MLKATYCGADILTEEESDSGSDGVDVDEPAVDIDERVALVSGVERDLFEFVERVWLERVEFSDKGFNEVWCEEGVVILFWIAQMEHGEEHRLEVLWRESSGGEVEFIAHGGELLAEDKGELAFGAVF